MKKISIIALFLLIGVGFVSVLPSKTEAITAGDGASSCTVTSVSPVVVGNQAATTIMATSSRRAYATVELPTTALGSATNTMALSFNNGNAATIGTGLPLSTTSPKREFGLDTLFPYVGPVSVITSTGSTTVWVTVCTYP